MRFIRTLGIGWVRRYHRLEVTGDLTTPTEPTLFVANHGFGGIVDLNVIAVMAAFEELNLDRSVTILTHQLAWTLRVGALLEPLGARPASRATALQALSEGDHVLVFPGGDLDAFKSHADRNRIVFGGRAGFARLAVDAGAPIQPVVTAGAGDTLFVLSDGRSLARALGLDRLVRLKALPVSVSVPWGLNVGVVGLLPYLPLPALMRTRILSPIRASSEEAAESLAAQVADAMQGALDDLAHVRQPRR